MAITIKKVSNRKELKKFVRFNYEFYKDNPYAVPDLYEDMMNTYSKDVKKNPAFEFCEADCFMAYRDGKIVGRVAAIINHKANKTWDKKDVRFGCVDFVDDIEVSRALLETVAEWGRERGMDSIAGPLGFTDMDPEGMLVEGFDRMGTMATIYNYPYYPEHMQRLGFRKDADWVEYLLKVPDKLPDKHKRIAEMIMKRYDLRIKKVTKKEVQQEGYGQKIFDLINTAYAPLYGYSKMNQAQIDVFVRQYLGILDLRMVSLVVDKDDNLVAVGITMASISEALRKAKGKLFPFGWFHLAKALFWKRPKVLDLLLVAVAPEYQNKGVNAILFYDLIPIFQKLGFECGESNPELELNTKVQAQWTYFESEQHKRRRAFRKDL